MKSLALTTRFAVGILALGVFVAPLHAEAALSSESEQYLRKHQIVQGANEQGDLRLDKEINRAELMKIVVKSAATTLPSKEEYANCFPDVHTEWFAPYVCWAYRNGYVKGYNDGYFHPERTVTEAEALKIVHEVFQLSMDGSFESYMKKNSDNEWYVPYLDAGEKSNLIDGQKRQRLHEKALRGEVFEEVSRAITLGETGKNSFSREDLTSLLTEKANPAFTTEEGDFFNALYGMIDYGFQPQTSTGSSLMKFSFSGGENRADVSLRLTEESAVKGTQDTFSKSASTLGLHADIKASGQGEVANVVVHIDGSILIDVQSGVYLKLTNFTIDTGDSSDSVKLMATSATDYVKEYIGKWYKVPLDANMQQDLATISLGAEGKNKMKDMVKKLAYHLMHTGNFLVVAEESTTLRTLPATHYTVSINEEIFTRTFPSFVGLVSSSPSFNRYEAKKDMHKLSPYLKKIFANFSVELWTDTARERFLSSKIRLLPVAFILPQEGNAMSISNMVLEMLTLEDYDYPLDVQIEIPTNAIDLNGNTNTL